MRNSAGADAVPEAGRLVAGRYRLLERIGAGGMGTVWRAGDEVLGRDVALKKLHLPPHLSDAERERLYERTRREARSAARIAHPNVIVVHDVVDDGGLPCIVMEYVPSRTLGDVLKDDGTLAPREAARIGHRMAEALRAAHAAGVLHRDVKPGNVLLGANGRVVLTDFGIAVSSGAPTLTRTGEIVGSLNYLSPERVKGRTPGPASDLWALGATLYEAVEGQAPFRRNTVLEAVYAIASDPLPPPYAAGPLTPLIEQLLDKEPQSRPDAETVEASLRALAAGEEVAVGRGNKESGKSGSKEHRNKGRDKGRGGRGRPGKGSGAPSGDQSLASAATLHDAGPHGAPTGGPAYGGHQAPGGPSAPGGATAPAAGPPSGPAPAAATDRPSTRPAPSRRIRVALAAAAVLAVAGAAAGAVFLLPGDDGKHTPSAKDPAASTATASPEPSDTSDPKEPEPTRSPSTTAPSSAAPDAEPPPVPAGYHLVDEPAFGVSLPAPDGWTRKTLDDGSTGFIDPTGLVRLQIDAPAFAAGPLRHWQDDEAQSVAEGKLPGYQQLRMERQTYRGLPAAAWEFTFEGRARDFRAVGLAFSDRDGTGHTVYLSAPAAQWDRYRPVFDTVLAGLRLHDEPDA